jgi:hypothetical protein
LASHVKGRNRLRVFKNMVLRRIFGTKLPNEELHNFYYSPNVMRMIKSRMIR